MASVRSLPDDLRAPIEPGETILGPLLRAGVPITHACSGHARCSTCRVRVVEGLEHCTPRTEEERQMADRIGLEDSIRLACQNRMASETKAVADVTVRRLVLDSVQAALGLLEASDRMAEYYWSAYDRSFAIRIGVHCGSVVVGSPTPWHRERDTVIGDVVNFASRIEAANKGIGSRLLVSDAVHQRVRDQVRVGRRVDLEIRGKSGVHTLYEVLGSAE